MTTISGGNELLNPKIVLNEAGIAENMAVGILGCGGHGHFVIPAGQTVGEHGKVYAVDILQSALHSVASRARLEGVQTVHTIWSDLEKLGATRIPAASLDVACLINVLFQNTNQVAVLTEALRLVKPGGTLLIVDWKAEAEPSFGPATDRRIDFNATIAAVQKLGATVVKKFDAGTYHFGVVFKK